MTKVKPAMLELTSTKVAKDSLSKNDRLGDLMVEAIAGSKSSVDVVSKYYEQSSSANDSV